MPLFNQGLDDEVITEQSVPVSGVNNSLPPSVIQQTSSSEAENRLAQPDSLNRPRPGIIRLKQTASSADSIYHLGNGVFLVSDGGAWYTYDNRSNVLTTRAGGPAYPVGSQVYSALANDTLYFSRGTTLNKYLAGTFGNVTLPANGPTAKYPIWAGNRLIYIYKNTLIVSDILDPEVFDVATGNVTLDPKATDEITSIILWQEQRLVILRNGETWICDTGPGLDVPDWSLRRVSATVGCRCHGTTVQCEADVMFLSETGRGVYRMSQAPASEQEGVWQPVSADVQDYIERINWNACDSARATYWNDLYMLSVPLDGSTFNNFILVYSLTLGQWQGTWCFDVGEVDVSARDFARDRTDIKGTALLVVTKDGIISRFTYPLDRRYFDENMDGTRQLFHSRLTTRAFTFGADLNLIRPHSVRLQFLESEDPVEISVIADRSIVLQRKTYETQTYLLSLPILPGFPFDLDKEGFRNVPIGLLHTGICSELQLTLEGEGNWSLFSIKVSAFPSMPLIAA